jgi:hypothetical protein
MRLPPSWKFRARPVWAEKLPLPARPCRPQVLIAQTYCLAVEFKRNGHEILSRHFLCAKCLHRNGLPRLQWLYHLFDKDGGAEMHIILLFVARRQEQVHPDAKRPGRIFALFDDDFLDCAFDRRPLRLNGLPDHSFIITDATLPPRCSTRCHKSHQGHNCNQLFRTHFFAPFILCRLVEDL